MTSERLLETQKFICGLKTWRQKFIYQNIKLKTVMTSYWNIIQLYFSFCERFAFKNWNFDKEISNFAESMNFAKFMNFFFRLLSIISKLLTVSRDLDIESELLFLIDILALWQKITSWTWSNRGIYPAAQNWSSSWETKWYRRVKN